MAKQKHSGPNSAANSPQEHPQADATHQERAWLAGLAWLGGLTPTERAAALAAVGAPAEPPATDGANASHATTLLDIAGEIRRWGSVGLYGAADRLEVLAARSTQPAVAADWAPDAERVLLALESAWQIEGSLGLILGSPSLTQAENLGVLSIAVRCNDLASVIMSALSDEIANLDRAHRTLHGTGRATEGAAL